MSRVQILYGLRDLVPQSYRNMLVVSGTPFETRTRPTRLRNVGSCCVVYLFPINALINPQQYHEDPFVERGG